MNKQKLIKKNIVKNFFGFSYFPHIYLKFLPAKFKIYGLFGFGSNEKTFLLKFVWVIEIHKSAYHHSDFTF